MTPEELGLKLAQELRWDIEKIGEAILVALEEANCHDMGKSFAKLLDHEIYGPRP